MSGPSRHPAFILFFLATFSAICRAQGAAGSSPADGTVFPSDSEVLWRTVSSAIHLLGVSILAYIIARCSDLPHGGLTSIPIARWLVIFIFIDSWLFLFAAGLLISGVGLSINSSACAAGIFLCIVLYAISKLFIYWFLVERVYLVHSDRSQSRIRSPVYCICIFLVLGYGIIITLAIVGRIAFLRDGYQPIQGTVYDTGNDNSCVIGIGRIASTTLLVYDALLNVFFTCMFLYPVYKSGNLSPRLKLVAKRTLGAATVSLMTSAINICVLTILHGQELGWICLASCGVDVAVNAMAIYAVTGTFDDHTVPESTVVLEKDSGMTPVTNSRKTLFTAMGAKIRGMLSSREPHLPIVNAGITSSTRSILGVSRSQGGSSDNAFSGLTVHFSINTPHQSRVLSQADDQGVDNPTSSTRQNDEPLADSASSPALEEGNAEVNVPIKHLVHPVQPGGVTAIRIGRRERHIGSQQPRSQTISAAPSLSTAESEDILLEVCHERPSSRQPRRHSFASFSGPTSPRNSIRPGEPRAEREEETNGAGATLSESLSTREVLGRRQVLSALGEIGGGKRRPESNPLEISVVTEIDRRIERKPLTREDALDDCHGYGHYRRGRSCSSSGL